MSGFQASDMQDMQTIYINAKFHFVEQSYVVNGQTETFNFQCTDENAAYYAPDYAQSILNGLNGVLADPDENIPATSSDDLGDTKIRFIFAEDPSDPCDAIQIHQSMPTAFNDDNAFNIVLFDDSSNGFSGQDNGNGDIDLKNVHEAVYIQGKTAAEIFGAGHVLLHEVGHHVGLCHSFAQGNRCTDMDPYDECGVGTGITLPDDCGSGTAPCDLNESNNVMSYITQTAMTFSQWITYYGALFEDTRRYKKAMAVGSCTSTSWIPSLVIQAGTHVVWNNIKFIDSNIVVETGATLEVNCHLSMGPKTSILVKRGGRLFVTNATIEPRYEDCRWRGISVEGNPSVDQPSIGNAQLTSYTFTNQDAGVVWLRDSEIKAAFVGLSVSGFTWSDPEKYGGLVMVSNTDFIDCGIGALFMRYKRVNKSYFITGTMTATDLHPDYGSVGVHIWECSGIEIQDIDFVNLHDYGIRGINFDGLITGCLFKGETNVTTYGIRMGATMPSSAEKPVIIDNCDFNNVKYGITASSTPNFISKLIIKNSRLVGPNLFTFYYGVEIFGQASFDIYGYNEFSNYWRGMHLVSTGSLHNKVRCNTFGTFGINALHVTNTNSRLEILGNTFTHSKAPSIQLSGKGSVVNEIIGHPSFDAGNCFKLEINAIISTGLDVEKFDYYVNDNSAPPCEETPTNNLSENPPGANKYFVYSSVGDYVTDGCVLPVPNLNYTIVDLGNARTDLAEAKSKHEANPTDSIFWLAYLNALYHKDSVLNDVVASAVASDDLDLVDSLFLGENDIHYDRAVVGLRVMRGDTAGANSMLNNLPRISQDDIWFQEIMAVNIKIATTDTLYKLSSQENQDLMAIASADSSILKGYACSLLALCAGYECQTGDTVNMIVLPLVAAEESNVNSILEQGTLELQVYPNPSVNGEFTIDWTTEAEIVNVFISDITGRIHQQFKAPNQTGQFTKTVNIHESGVYFVTLSTNSGVIKTVKVVVLMN